MTISINSDLRSLLKKYGKLVNLVVSKTKRHIRICNMETGGFVIASATPSDWRTRRNLEADLRRLCAGVGYGQRTQQHG